jgi:hypothetical protein
MLQEISTLGRNATKNLLQGCVLLHTWWTVCQGTVRARLQGENTVQYVDVMDRIGSRLGAAYTLDR